MKLYLTICHGGRGLLTFLKPTISKIYGTNNLDAFERVGEPIAIRYLCADGMKSLFGELPEPLTPTRYEITINKLDNGQDQLKG